MFLQQCVDVIKMGDKIGCMITHGLWVFIVISKSVEVMFVSMISVDQYKVLLYLYEG
jgi:hypothetical protein